MNNNDVEGRFRPPQKTGLTYEKGTRKQNNNHAIGNYNGKWGKKQRRKARVEIRDWK